MKLLYPQTDARLIQGIALTGGMTVVRSKPMRLSIHDNVPSARGRFVAAMITAQQGAKSDEQEQYHSRG